MPPSQSPLPFDDLAAPAERGVQLLMQRAAGAESGMWDELRTPEGHLRPVWRRFGLSLGASTTEVELAAELDRRRVQVAQQLRRDGVTHNVFDDQGVATRPWSLELLPLLIEPADWALIEAGVMQRAALLEAMLADLYGPQALLHEGLVPPALLMRHPGFLRPLLGAPPAGGQRLHIVAFDLVRGVYGRWWVVAQRTQGPSGLGYVLHNRLTISRQFPEAFRDLRVQHIASSYRRLVDTVEQAAAEVAGTATPRVVLLTPGTYSETYFEHAYLARYLGLPLVEGGDLTVRKQRLYLKTVEGLEPVHGVLRRLDDDYCDPLELRPDSTLGVSGLLQAVRAGSVVMANALGSAFLESPALQGFLPGVSERLLGEPLALPSLPTWWCGEPAAWQDVRGRLADKVLRTTFPAAGRTSQVRAADIAAIDDDADAWTVQQRLRYSRAPIWGDDCVTPRPAMVRVYAIADRNGRWHVLPGGMTRVAPREDGSVSMQRGGSSLDTWVLTDGPVDSFSMLPQRLSVDDIGRRQRPVTSRTAEHLFWLGRYTERTEQQVRLARSTLTLIDADNDADAALLQAVSALAVRSGLAPVGVPTLVQAAQVFERALLQALPDAAESASVAFNLRALARASQALRDRLSSEQWGLIRTMDERFAPTLRADGPALPDRARVLPVLDRLGLSLAAVTGMQTDRMTRDHGWRLLTVGRLLERLIGLCTQLEVFGESGALGSLAGVDLLLDLFDSAISFRARYQRHEDLLALTGMLVLDSDNPRSLAGVLRRLRTELRKLPGSDAGRLELLQRLPADGTGLSPEALRGLDDAGIMGLLLPLAGGLRDAAWGLSEEIGLRHFTLAHGTERRL